MSVGQLQGSGSALFARFEFVGSGVLRVLRRIVLGTPSPASRDSLLLDAAVEIRSGAPDEALKRLRPYLNVLTRDSAFLNLMGAAHEARGKSGYAHELYRVALIADPHYAPARRNLHRLREWDGDISTRRPALLGDVELRKHRAVNARQDVSIEATSTPARPPAPPRAAAPAPTRFIIITRCT